MESSDKKKYNSDVTKEELQRLNDDHIRNDGGDDSILKNRKKPVDFTGKDLDIPGRKLPKNTTKKTLKDEENQLYSQGSEHNENLEDSI
ncbi:hypothetical protein [Tenacibaculum sp. IB213877]|uniref:hypothetical protein n=1 Tax=Tenacibaculum sp. IB213877 TaxID=3097351 RepID=UPI002A5AF851|nr:hypothetical protein [Tenacibaculum sp. IB213877]MDY0779341.1 hypothetical protein [Tenacibaculum sp. IB213877]